MEIIAFNPASFWSQWLWPILLFVIGLGAVVFVHEFGHFIVAKLVGIKVERFALGFGPRLVGVRIGETDYCIKLLPLGGYVKMLGQEDFKPLAEGDRPDPRSFPAKSVAARFAVISAGVVMNVIFAAILFVVVGLIGKNFPAPVVGGVSRGFPAAEAQITWQPRPGETAGHTSDKGLKSGDRITGIEGDSILLWIIGNRIASFSDVAITAALADLDDKYTFTIEREVDGHKRTGKAVLGVKLLPDESKPIFGISPAWKPVIGERKDVIVSSDFEKNDRIVAVNGVQIRNFQQIAQLQEQLTGKEVTVTVQRKGKRHDITVQPELHNGRDVYYLKDGSRIRGELIEDSGPQRSITVRLADGTSRTIADEDREPGLLNILGMLPRLRVVTVKKGSPAEKAGVLPGDIIVGYGERGAPSLGQLLAINSEFLNKDTNIVVQRGRERKKLSIRPKTAEDLRTDDRKPLIGVGHTVDLMHSIVAEVMPGSPAARVGIEPGSQITKINGAAVNSWVDVYAELKRRPGQNVTIAWRFGALERSASLGPLTEEQFRPQDYQFSLFRPDVAFEPLLIRIRQTNPLTALGWGCKETLRMILANYVSFRSLIKGTVSVKTVSGPVGIGALAVKAGRSGIIDFVYFIAFISAVLAVVNFLPVPVVDGGHAVFLLIEKIRGKPVPVKVMNIAQMIGLAMIIGVMIAVTWKDIAGIVRGLWW